MQSATGRRLPSFRVIAVTLFQALADLYEQVGRWNDRGALLERLCRWCDGQNIVALPMLDAAGHVVNASDFDRAQDILRTALDEAPDDAELLLGLVKVYRHTGAGADEMTTIQALLAQPERDPPWASCTRTSSGNAPGRRWGERAGTRCDPAGDWTMSDPGSSLRTGRRSSIEEIQSRISPNAVYAQCDGATDPYWRTIRSLGAVAVRGRDGRRGGTSVDGHGAFPP